MASLKDMLGEEEGGGSDKEDAAQDLIDAIKSGDAKAVSLAFATLYEHCSPKASDEDTDEDDDGYEG